MVSALIASWRSLGEAMVLERLQHNATTPVWAVFAHLVRLIILRGGVARNSELGPLAISMRSRMRHRLSLPNLEQQRQYSMLQAVLEV